MALRVMFLFKYTLFTYLKCPKGCSLAVCPKPGLEFEIVLTTVYIRTHTRKYSA